MWNAFWWITNLLVVVGLLTCLIGGIRARSLGLLLLAAYFCYNLSLSFLAAFRQHQHEQQYVAHFVRQQIGPNTWTAPVLYHNVDVAAPFIQAILVLGVVLVSRQLVTRAARVRPGSPKPARGI